MSDWKSGAARVTRQIEVSEWCERAFGREHAMGIPQRGIRLLEEAIELAQACDVDPAMAHRLIDFVFARPKGDIRQEMGGVGVCLLALGEAAGLDADDTEAAEFARVLAKPLEHFTARNEQKNAAGFDATPGKPAT